MLDTYEEAECPGDTVAFLVDRLQFKYQAQLPGSSEGTYHFRVYHTPRPHAYRILRVRAGLPQETLRFGAKPSTEPELVYCCTITFTPFSSILDWNLFPVVEPNNSCVDSDPHKVNTDSTIVNPKAIVDVSSIKDLDHGSDTAALQTSPSKADSVLHKANADITITSPKAVVDVSSSVSGSYRKGKERETNLNVHPAQAPSCMTCYEIAELHADPEHWDKGLSDVILRCLLDVISVHEAQRPGEREPTVVVIAKDDADKKFYASYGFVESDEAVEGQLLRMVLRKGVIRALVKKRRAGEMDGEDIWTRRRREYEQIWIEAEDKRGDKQPEEISKEEILKQEILKKQILKQEILKESLSLLEDIPGNEQPEEIVEVLCLVKDTPGDGAKRTNSLPLRLHPKTHIETSEEQGGRRKRAKSSVRHELDR